MVLKKYYEHFPKKFVVVTPHYNDCTCDLVYLIWNRIDTVAFPIDRVDYIKELLEHKDYDYRALIDNWNKGKIIIDTFGNKYYEGKILDKAGLEAVLRKISRYEDKFARWVSISLPPYLNTRYANKIKSVVKEIETMAEKYKVKAQIGG